MKYLKRFNESLSKDDLKNLIYDIEDILVEVDDLNINEEEDFIYDVTGGGPLLNVDISKDDYYYCHFSNKKQFSDVKKILDRVIRQVGDNSIWWIIEVSSYNSDGDIVTNNFESDQYEKLFNNFLTKEKYVIGDGENKSDINWHMKSLIKGIKLIFRLKEIL